jgi:hypothetical protein
VYFPILILPFLPNQNRHYFDAQIPFFTFFYSPKLVKIQKSCRTWTGKIYISFGRFTGNGEQLGAGVREKKFYRFK